MTTLPPHADNGNLIPTTSGIYKIFCTANKKIYIGSTANLRQRKRQHFDALRRNTHKNPSLQNAWNKYGEQAFVFEVLELVLPMDPTGREQYWLNMLQPFGRKGFNIRRKAESNLGLKHSPETRENLRQAKLGKPGHKHTPEEIENLRQVHLGRKKHTPESKAKISQSKLGKKRTPESIEKSRQGNIGKKNTPEAIEASRQARTGMKRSAETRANISQAMIGRKRTPEAAKKSADGHRGLKRSPEFRERQRQAALAQWAKKKEKLLWSE